MKKNPRFAARVEEVEKFCRIMSTRLGYRAVTVRDTMSDEVDAHDPKGLAPETVAKHLSGLDEALVDFRRTWEPKTIVLPETITVMMVMDNDGEEIFANWTQKKGAEDPVGMALQMRRYE